MLTVEKKLLKVKELILDSLSRMLHFKDKFLHYFSIDVIR